MGKLAGERILLAGMVRREQVRQVSGQLVVRAVRERKGRESADLSLFLEQAEISLHGNCSQSQKRLWAQDFELGFKILTAVQ